MFSVPPTTVVSVDVHDRVCPARGDGAAGVGDRAEEVERPAAGRLERSGVGDAAAALADVEVLTRRIGVDRPLVDNRQRAAVAEFARALDRVVGVGQRHAVAAQECRSVLGLQDDRAAAG